MYDINNCCSFEAPSSPLISEGRVNQIKSSPTSVLVYDEIRFSLNVVDCSQTCAFFFIPPYDKRDLCSPVAE